MATDANTGGCFAGREFPFKDCGEMMKMMKGLCGKKDGTIDFEKACARMMKFCREMKCASTEKSGNAGEGEQDHDRK